VTLDDNGFSSEYDLGYERSEAKTGWPDTFKFDSPEAHDCTSDGDSKFAEALEPHRQGEPPFGSGGYNGDYNGVPDCWYSSDGYVYGPDGQRIGAH
jgi:hypothetical protein